VAGRKITLYFTNGLKLEFCGRFLREREKPNWHYYEVERAGSMPKGTIIHCRKEHFVAVVEEPIDD
jgi:hypothetical protein